MVDETDECDAVLGHASRARMTFGAAELADRVEVGIVRDADARATRLAGGIMIAAALVIGGYTGLTGRPAARPGGGNPLTVAMDMAPSTLLRAGVGG